MEADFVALSMARDHSNSCGKKKARGCYGSYVTLNIKALKVMVRGPAVSILGWYR